MATTSSFSLIRPWLLSFVLAAVTGCSHKKGGGTGGLPVGALVRSTVGATVKAPVEATRVGVAVMENRVRTLALGNAPGVRRMVTGPHGVPAGTGARGEAFEALLDQKQLPPRTSGSLEFYVDGQNFFPLYLRELQAARQSIDVQTYIFDNDDFAVRVADVLRAKSREVPVRVIYDGHGSDNAAEVTAKTLPASHKPPEDMRDYLKTGSQVEVRRTANAYLMADHSKLHIIDGQKAFVGGMNLGREYRHEWHDMMARAEGPVVQDLQRQFERHWRSDAWWRKLARDKAPTTTPTPTTASQELPPEAGGRRHVPLRLLLTDARHERQDVLRATLLGIRCAARRVWIETPYFSSDEIVAELEAALKRGVDVRIVVPADVDHQIMQANNAADLKKLIDLGARIYAYPGMTHLKATVCDDWAMFGSANYDTLSQRINVEMNLASSDRSMVNALVDRVFHPDFSRSRRMTAAMAQAEGSMAAEFVGDQL